MSQSNNYNAKRKEKSKECLAQSVAKTNLKTERIENYGERQIQWYFGCRPQFVRVSWSKTDVRELKHFFP